MNNARRLSLAVLVIFALALPAAAEVSAETDLTGHYVRTVISASLTIKNLRIWTVSRTRPTYWPLNGTGDLRGDLWPYVAENPVQQRWPWVAWSEFNGSDYDLVYSHWTAQGWAPVAAVERFPSSDDALDPEMNFDADGRTHMVWVGRGRDGRGHVYLSVFLSTRWMAPFPVSDAVEDALNPSVTVRADGAIVVTYDTPAGAVTRTVKFTKPHTITDDITPFNTMTITSTVITPVLTP